MKTHYIQKMNMKTTFSVALFLVLISATAFVKEPLNYEQAAFDHFFSEIFPENFKDVSVIGFSGRTEKSFSTMGKYESCLKPKERLQSLFESITNTPINDVRTIRYDHLKNISISDAKDSKEAARLYVYHSLHVADNYYVFVAFQQPEKPLARYLFELTPDGKISRDCKMN
jgi:hypothetical protein